MPRQLKQTPSRPSIRLKRGGKVEFVSLDLQHAENRYRLERVESLTPEKIFNARWAMALLGAAMNRLGSEYVAQGKTAIFEVLKAFLDPMVGEKEAQIASFKDPGVPVL